MMKIKDWVHLWLCVGVGVFLGLVVIFLSSGCSGQLHIKSAPIDKKPKVERVAGEGFGSSQFPIEVGRVQPGTETTDTPIYKEWKTLGEWTNVHGKNGYLRVQYNEVEDRFYFQACAEGEEGPVPSIILGGASNQCWVKFIPKEE